jgi:hypothetical protein
MSRILLFQHYPQSNLYRCVLFVVVEALCLVLAEEVVAVLAVGVEVAILAVMVGLIGRLDSSCSL